MSADEAPTGTSPDADEEHDGLPAKKKKFFQMPKSLKRLFGRKRTKSKDDDGITSMHIKSKSYSDVLEANSAGANEEEEEQQSLSNRGMSMSADSVFSQPEKTPTTAASGPSFKTSTRSMEMLPPHTTALTSELKERVRGRHLDAEDKQNHEDDSLSHSPLTGPSTADIFVDNGFKEKSLSQESECSRDSMASSKNEVREFFDSKWTAGISKSPRSGHTSDNLDLDAIAVDSARSLSSNAARHKIELKHRTKRGHPSHPHSRVVSPKTAAGGGVEILPQVCEEVPVIPTGEKMVKEVQQDRRGSPISDIIESNSKGEADFSQQQSFSAENIGLEVCREPEQEATEQTETKESPPENHQRTTVAKKESVTEKPDPTGHVLPQQSDEKEISFSPPAAITILRRESSGSRDLSKRQTIAAAPSQEEEEVTIFGTRKKRSSFHELKPWEEEIAGNKHYEETHFGAENTEFAEMFHRFQRHASQKKNEMETKDSKIKKKKVPTATLR